MGPSLYCCVSFPKSSLKKYHFHGSAALLAEGPRQQGAGQVACRPLFRLARVAGSLLESGFTHSLLPDAQLQNHTKKD